MIRFSRICCLLVGLSLIALANFSLGLQLPEAKFARQFQNLTTMGAESLGIEETEALLKQLRFAYLAADNAQNQRDDFTRILNGLVDDLSILDPEKCHLESLHNFANQISAALKSKLAKAPIIVRYIKHMANAQFGLCHSEVDTNFKQLIESLVSESLDEKLDILVESLIEAKKLEYDEQTFRPETLSELENRGDQTFPIGLMKFIRETKFGYFIPFDLRFNVNINKEEFLRRFEEYFEELCSSVVFTLGEYADIYRNFLPEGMLAQDDELAREWVYKIAVCKTIVDNSYRLSLLTRSVWAKQSELKHHWP